MKNVKKNAIFFKLFWYKVFVHWKLKLLNFLVDSVLLYCKEGAGSWLLWATRGVRNPNFHVAITHASHICSQFHKEWMQCKECNWSGAFGPSITRNLIMHVSVKGNLHKAQQWSKSIFTFWSLSPAPHSLWLSLVIAYMYYIIGTTHNSLATKWPFFYSAQWFNKLYYHVTIRQ